MKTEAEKIKKERREAFYAGERDLTLSEKLANAKAKTKGNFEEDRKVVLPVQKRASFNQVVIKQPDKVRPVRDLETMLVNDKRLRVKRLYKNGKRQGDLAIMFNLSISQVKRICSQMTFGQIQKLLKEEKQEIEYARLIKKMRSEGESFRTIEYRLGLSRCVVRGINDRFNKGYVK